MKNSYTYKAISLVMAFWVLVSSLGISLDMHFCKGELKSVRLFGVAENCHILTEKNSRKTSSKIICSKVTKNCKHQIETTSLRSKKRICCNNEHIDFLVHDFLQKELSFKFFPLKSVYGLFFFDYFSLVRGEAQYIPSPFLNYKAPSLYKDIPVLVQSFLL